MHNPGGPQNVAPILLADVSRSRIAFRPRILYSTIYVWNAVACGKFTAPFLQHLSPRFSDGVVGATFALQYAVMASLAGWGGSLADARERASSSWGRGRVQVLACALSAGSLALLGHGVPEYARIAFPNNSTAVLSWHIAMRCVYGASMGVMVPCLDGLTLAHLGTIEGASSTEFGTERMYGALWWGVGSLAAGIGIDHYGFHFLYAMLCASYIAIGVAMGVYLWSLDKDTTGAFDAGTLAEMRSWDKNDEVASNAVSHAKLLRTVFETLYGKVILFSIFTLAMGISVVDNLAFLFFDSLGASNTMDGWTVVFTVIFEIPMFCVAPLILRRFGPGTLLLAAGVAYIIRVVGYTLVPDGSHAMHVILLLETLHGVTYAGLNAGSVEFIARLMPAGYEASGLGIQVTVSYVGVVAGLIGAGVIEETLGARTMFRAMAAIVALGIVVNLLAERFCERVFLDSKLEGDSDENSHLIKSESGNSCGSAFADKSTERFMRSLKYDSLNKYVKDW